MDLTSTKQG